MLDEHALDFGRIDVLAAADDRVVLAIDDVHVTLVVLIYEVAAVEPATAERLRRRVGAVEIAEHHRRPPIDDLADLARGDVAVGFVDDPALHRARRPSHRAELAQRVGGTQVRRVRRHLGLTEGADHALPGQHLDHPLEQCPTSRGASPDRAALAAQAAGDVAPGYDQLPLRRHVGTHGRGGALHQIEGGLGIEAAAGLEHDAVAEQQKRV